MAPGNTASRTDAQGATLKELRPWMRAVLAADFTHLERNIAVRLALFVNDNGQSERCDPSAATLAEKVGIDERATRRAIHKLADEGWLVIDASKGRHSNSFGFVIPATAATRAISTRVKSPRVEARPTRANSRISSASNPGQNRPPNIEVSKKENKKQGKYINPTLFDTGRDLVVADSSPATRSPSRKKESAAALDAAFDRFWAAYPRKHSLRRARAAFTRAVTDGATVDDIMAGLARYVAAKPYSAPTFAFYPANFLKEKMWLDDHASSSSGSRSWEEVAIDVVNQKMECAPYVH